MKNIFCKIKYNGGYAILFTVIIIGSISALTAGLANTIYKQLVLSSLVKSSQSAFYQADTAADCALYADLVINQKDPSFFKTPGQWACGKINLDYVPIDNGGFEISPHDMESLDPCFYISVEKNPTGEVDVYNTKIIAEGYNICNLTNPRVVEREIEINY